MEILLLDFEPDVVLVSETWCNSDITMAMLNIKGYSIDPDLRKDRNDTSNGIGGGLLVYAKEGLLVKPKAIANNFNMYSQFEILNKGDSKNSLTITLVYKPPNSSGENIKELCKLFEVAGKNSLFIGDFNFPDIDWLYQTSDRKSNAFLQSTIEYQFEQMVHFKTHVRGNILDLVLTNNLDHFLRVEPLGNLSNSDHSIIMTEILFETRFNASKELICDWKNGDKVGLNEYLKNIDWDIDLEHLSTESSWIYFKDKIHEGMDYFIPKIPRRRNNKPIWLNNYVLRLIRRKQRRYNLYMQTRSAEHEANFRVSQKECKKAVRKSKMRFEKQLASNGNKRPFNSYIKSKTKSRTGVGPLKLGDVMVTDNDQMATILNNYFCGVFTREDVGNVPQIPTMPVGSFIETIVFDKNKVLEKINKLKPSTAQGPDYITARVLKENSEVLSYPLSLIFEKSMNTGIVPQDWKLANVTPIFKKGSKSLPENYRPVSLTSICCKLMETVIRDQINDHLTINYLIKPSQHGFMKNKSVTTNLLEFLEKITSITDEGLSADIIYLDFSKAFDKVPIQRLIEKIRAHGIRGNILQWFQEWLSNRKQRTVLNGSCSEWIDVVSGVPQGSVLGPLAFVLFINDIDDEATLITILKKFADDTKLGHQILSLEDCQTLQNCLNKLTDWATKWCMEFNVKKCRVLHVGRCNPEFSYKIYDQVLETADRERDIGVLIDHKLKPSLQCAEAARRANAILTQITKAFLYRDRFTFLRLYIQFVRCHLEFAVPAWSPWNVCDIELLERVQIRAINQISGLQGKTYKEKLSELHLKSLEERRVHLDLIQTYKILKGIDDVEMVTWFQRVGSQTQRLTRNTAYPDNLVQKRSRTDPRQHFFSNRVVKYWNALPTDIKNAKSLPGFKTLLKRHRL